MNRNLSVGQAVIFVDSHRVDHPALVTNVWKDFGGGYPGCNVVFVSADESKTDPYGRQVERATSVAHQSQNSARAMCWRYDDEVALAPPAAAV